MIQYQKFSNDKELIILSDQFRDIHSKPYNSETYLIDLQNFNANLAKFKTRYSKYEEFLNLKVKEENERLSAFKTPGCGKRSLNADGTTNSDCCSTWEHIQVAFVAGIGCDTGGCNTPYCIDQMYQCTQDVINKYCAN